MNVRSPLPRLALGAVLALAVGLAPTGTAAASAAGPAPTSTVKAEVTQAKAALAQAVAQVKAGKTRRARTSLTAVRTHTAAANTDALNLIGKPPTDPESDDVPGPPAVTAALKLDATIVTGVAALLNGTTAPLVKAIKKTLTGVQAPRDTVVNKVVSLKPEGAGADYADGMSDLLPLFKKEVKTLTTDLGAFKLTASGRAGLQTALSTSQATQKVFVKAYGGGERPAGA
jgi:hypothetical protein